jgi:hypothetical protein
LRKLQKYRIELKQVLKEMADSGRAAAGRGKTAKK